LALAFKPGVRVQRRKKVLPYENEGTVTGDCVECESYGDWNLGTNGYKRVRWDVPNPNGCKGPKCGPGMVHSTHIQLEKCVKIGKELPFPKDFSNGLYDE